MTFVKTTTFKYLFSFLLMFVFSFLGLASEFTKESLDHPLAVEHFKLVLGPENQRRPFKELRVFFESQKIEWRYDQHMGVLLPWTIISIEKAKTSLDTKTFGIIYQNKSYLFDSTNFQIKVSLLSKEKIYIKSNDVLLAEVSIELNHQTIKDQYLKLSYIDHSCYRYNLDFLQYKLKDIFSLFCHSSTIGSLMDETKYTKLSMIMKDSCLKDLNECEAFHTTLINNNTPIRANLYAKQNPKKTYHLDLKGQFKKSKKRLSLALGLGPYIFDTSNEGKVKEEASIAPTIMFYANFQLDTLNSVRAFNATIFRDSIFSNTGLYYANDVTVILNRRLTLTTLLGVQYLHFQLTSNDSAKSGYILPQGLEFTYRHFLDIPNYIVSGGFFLSPESDVSYQNLWIRWGKSIFWELNYIEWTQSKNHAKMWGLSVGIPLFSFF